MLVSGLHCAGKEVRKAGGVSRPCYALVCLFHAKIFKPAASDEVWSQSGLGLGFIIRVGIRVFSLADVSPCLGAMPNVSHRIAILEVYASIESYCWMLTH